MAPTISAETVRDACLAAGITRIDHHECGLCGWMTAYYVQGGQLWFDPSCNCCAGDGARPATWQEAADWIDMQTNPEVRDRLMRAFGIA